MSKPKSRVTFVATEHDQSVYVVELDDPGHLLYAAEQTRIASVFNLAWFGWIRDHPVAIIDFVFGRAMSYARRNQVMTQAARLLRRILNERGER